MAIVFTAFVIFKCLFTLLFVSVIKTFLMIYDDQILKKILFEYGSFDVITIDKFTYRLVRTFYREFKLSYGFEVIIDPKFLFEELVGLFLDCSFIRDTALLSPIVYISSSSILDK